MKKQSKYGKPDYQTNKTTRLLKPLEEDAIEIRFKEQEFIDVFDAMMDFTRFTDGTKEGWLVNMQPSIQKHSECDSGKSAIDLYFLEDDGSSFKCTFFYNPYFLVMCKANHIADVQEYLLRKFNRLIFTISIVEKKDLSIVC